MATRTVTSGLTLSNTLAVVQASGSAKAFSVKRTGDTYNRFEVTEDGRLGWNDGSYSYMGVNVSVALPTLTFSCDAALFDFSAGWLRAANGAAANPAYSFGSDTGSGMYRSGLGVLNFAVSGSEVMRATSAGVKVKSTGAFGTVEKFRVNTPTTADNLANIILSANAAADRALVLQAAASQSAAIFYVGNSSGTSLFSVASNGALAVAGSITIADAKDVVINTTTGTKFGTGTTQKLGFWNATPIVQPANTVALDDVLVNTGLRASGGVNGFTRGVEINSTGALGTVEKFRVNLPTTVDNAANVIFGANATGDKGVIIQRAPSGTASHLELQNSAGTAQHTWSGATYTIADNGVIATGTTTGMKIGTGTTQKIGFWNKTPIVQPTTAITAAAFVANTSGIVDDTATFGGYTLGKIAAALINCGILA